MMLDWCRQTELVFTVQHMHFSDGDSSVKRIQKMKIKSIFPLKLQFWKTYNSGPWGANTKAFISIDIINTKAGNNYTFILFLLIKSTSDNKKKKKSSQSNMFIESQQTYLFWHKHWEKRG